jgi:esterase/lipase superfamily enzyme
VTVAIYGDSGTPIIGFPTRGKGSDQWEECGMTGAIEYQLENGFNQLFCVESVDNESFLNEKIEPHKRLLRHEQYEDYIIEEIIPYIREQNSIQYLITAGVDLGGYHAINFALKHPGEFNKAIGISGPYDLRKLFDDFYSDTLYYNSPIDFLPNITEEKLLKKIKKVDYRLISYANDERKDQANKLDSILRKKNIEHHLDIWEDSSEEEWDLWNQMLHKHVV